MLPKGKPFRMFRSLAAALVACVFGIAAIALPTTAAPSGPVEVIQGFYATLLEVMKNAAKLGFAGRQEKLAPAIDAAFDLPLMTRLSVGPQWQNLSPEEQKQVTDAFRRMTLATYANRFDGYSGEKFEVAPQPTDASSGKLVQTKLIQSDGEIIPLNYLMRDSGGSWKIIDVFLKGTVSELATRRSEFTSVLRRDGAAGLIKTINDKAAAESKS